MCGYLTYGSEPEYYCMYICCKFPREFFNSVKVSLKCSWHHVKNVSKITERSFWDAQNVYFLRDFRTLGYKVWRTWDCK